jgi:hypothetical protein
MSRVPRRYQPGSVAGLIWGVLLTLLALPAACPASAPPSIDLSEVRARAITKSAGGVRVSTAVLSDDESQSIYGLPLASKGIQPVWIEVVNKDDHAYWLLFPGVDPDYFPPSEVLEAFPGATAEETGRREQRLRALSFQNPVPPGATVSGFVLANLNEGARLVQTDLWASQQVRSFSFVVVVPGLRADYLGKQNKFRETYSPGEVVDYTDDAEFRAALEALPCCVTNKGGTKNGDPLNLVMVGDVDAVFPALVRRNWTLTEVTWRGSVMRMIRSALSGDRYPYAPISNLYLYGRPQDIALQKARDNIHQRNHLRLWRAPMLYHGEAVWVGQISRDIGSRLTIHSPTFTTHKIDPDIDRAMLGLTSDMFYSQNLWRFSFVGGVGAATRDAPKRNLTTDPYYTRGLRAVLFFDSHPTALSQIEYVRWDRILPPAEAPAASGPGSGSGR